MADERGGPTPIRTFLIADVRGYTRFTEDQGDEAGARLAGRFAEVVTEVVAGRDGQVVELRGDEALCVFESPRGALRAAIDLQRRCAVELRADPTLPLWVGVGIDAGEAVPVADGYRGGALNLAARLCSLAGPGEVLVSDGIVHLARRVDDTSYLDRGRNRVKGLADPVHVFKADFPLDLPEIPRTPAPRWTRTRIAVIAFTGLVALAAVAALALTRGGGGPAPVAIHANSLAEIDVKARRVVVDVPLGAEPGDVVSGGGWVWVADEPANSVIRVDPATSRVAPPPAGVGIDPAALAFGDGGLWVYDPVDGLLAKLDPDFAQRATPSLFGVSPCPKQPTGTTTLFRYGCKLGGIAVGDHHVWIGRDVGSQASFGSGGIWRVDPHRPRPTRTPTIRHVPAAQLAYGAGSIWTSSWWGGGKAAQIGATHGNVVQEPVPANSGGGSSQNLGLTYAYGYAWLVSPSGDLLELASGHLPVGESGFQNSVRLSPGSFDVAAGGGYLWVTSSAGTLTQISPYTPPSVVKVYQLGHPAYGVCYTRNRVWVGVTNP